MKKVLIFLVFLISLKSYSQGVKISAMPTWTTSLDSVWFPIIYNDGTNWINYRAQGYTITGGGGGGTVTASRGLHMQELDVRWGGELDSAVFVDQVSFPITFGTGNYPTLSGSYSYFQAATNYLDLKQSDGTASAEILSSITNDGEVDLITTNGGNASQILVRSIDGIFLNPNGGLLYGTSLTNVETDKILYWNNVNGLITWGDVPSGGGGGGSGIVSMDANNGVTILTDSIAQLGSATDGPSTFTGIRYIDASTFYLQMKGTGTYTFRAITGSSRAISGEATGAGIGVTGIGASGSAGIGVQGTADNAAGVGVQGASIAGTGVLGNTTTGSAGTFTASPSSTNTSAQVMQVIRATSGTAADGIGGYISFLEEYSSPSTIDESARIGSTFTSISARTSDLNFSTKLSNSLTETMTLKSTGNLHLNGTGKGYATKSPDGTVWYIVVSNAGVVSATTTAP